MKARVFPSGEKAGVESPRNPADGDVILRFSRLPTESRKMLFGSVGESLPEKPRLSPSGDQDSALPCSYSVKNAEVPAYSLRSGPPSAGTRKMSISLPDWRTKAMW